ncbi:MAG TPA: hypothetical protein VHX61_09375 [Rhizomicrobium sp.]|jgi:hypothetical protein|nr:hypothetical protein [Rhizomicrobium sp.]
MKKNRGSDSEFAATARLTKTARDYDDAPAAHGWAFSADRLARLWSLMQRIERLRSASRSAFEIHKEKVSSFMRTLYCISSKIAGPRMDASCARAANIAKCEIARAVPECPDVLCRDVGGAKSFRARTRATGFPRSRE